MELSEVSLDVSLLRNHLRLRFTDSAILNVSFAESGDTVYLLAVTVSSIHRIVFPLHTDNTKSSSTTLDTQRDSIFYDASAFLKDRSIFYVIDGTMAINVPHLAASDMLGDKEEAYFAVDYHSKLMLYIMNSRTGGTVSHEIKESHLVPRFLSNLKGALT